MQANACVIDMGKKKRVKQKALTELEDVQDEVLAIESIFGSSFEADENRKGFKLRIVPHPGEAEANYTSVMLEFG